MNICVMCHYFWPELGAPSARLKEMADVWVKDGHTVTVVTCFPNHPQGVIYPGYKQTRFMTETIDGIRVLRCLTYATPNKGIVKKTLGHLVFALSAPIQAARHLKGTDIVVISSPPLFSGIGAYLLSKRLRCPYIIEVRDLWPAIFVELGILKNKLVIGILEQLELFLYRGSRHVVAVTHSFAEDIVRRRTPAAKVSVIPNGVDLGRFFVEATPVNKKQVLNVEGKFVVLYLGTHGISQALTSIVETAKILRDEKEIQFVFVGEGAEKDLLVGKVQEYGLSNVTFMPGQPKDAVPDIYRCADVCLVPLRNIPLFKTFIPSKMFEVMAVGVPLVACVEGEAERILSRSDGGAVVCRPEDSVQLSKAILELKCNPEKRREMVTRGRAFVEKEYNRRDLAQRYLTLMRTVLAQKS